MARATILVVGATGNVGTELVKHLVQSGHAVRVLARDPRRAAERLGRGVEVVLGDLGDPASLTSALRGVEIASLATTPSPLLQEQECNFIDAAREARLRRLVKLSGFGIDFATDRIHACHAESEERLRASGVPSVVLRPVIFMSNVLMDAAAIRTGRLPSVFGDSRVSFIDPRDVAELTARALVEGRHDGETWEFGGPEALTYDDLAATLTDVLGRRIAHVRLDAAAFREVALRAALPDFVIEAITGSATFARAGKYAVDDDVVQKVLGRRASTFRDWALRHRDALS
jgi:uncharacterized protein YbjT (DUF2867 family)